MDYPGEKLILKLWETLAERGVGGLLEPWQIRRIGEAQIEVRTKEMLAIANAERQIGEIRRGLRQPLLLDQDGGGNGECSERKEPTIDPVALLEIAKDSEAIVSIKKEINLAKTIVHAEQELKGDETPVSGDKVGEDWLYRWRDYAGAVSSEDLQSLWGKVLAGEIKSPGTFSPRTLDFLRGLSHREATEIAKLSRYVVGNRVFRGDTAFLDAAGLTLTFMLRMQELGLLNGVESASLSSTYTVSPNSILSLTSHGMVLLVSGPEVEKKISIPAYIGTTLLSEIIQIGTFDPDIEYLKRLGEHLKKSGVKVEIAKYISIGNGAIKFSEAEEL